MLQISRDKDKTEIRNMYNRIFAGEEEFAERFFELIWKSENCLISRTDSGIISAVNILPTVLALGEERYSAGYVYAAMTDTAYRGTGEMSRLLELSFRQGDDFSILIVQNDSLFNYYSRFGYLPLCTVNEKSVEAKSADGFEIIKADTEDYKDLLQIYRESVKSAIYAERNEQEFTLLSRLYDLPFYAAKRDGRITAYCIGNAEGGKFIGFEAMGEDSAELVAGLADMNGCQLGSFKMAGADKPIGMIKPISVRAHEVLRDQHSVYINLLYN